MVTSVVSFLLHLPDSFCSDLLCDAYSGLIRLSGVEMAISGQNSGSNDGCRQRDISLELSGGGVRLGMGLRVFTDQFSDLGFGPTPVKPEFERSKVWSTGQQMV
jgi:hypothetical protein